MGGYSRGAAVANLLAGRINKDLPEIDRKNVFVYTFATPVALTAASYPDYQLDYDNNHNADGTLKTTWAASNIYNILSSGDLVPGCCPPSGATTGTAMTASCLHPKRERAGRP